MVLEFHWTSSRISSIRFWIGFDVCRALRQNGIDVAIQMLAAKTQVVDRVVGLKLGADDYLRPNCWRASMRRCAGRREMDTTYFTGSIFSVCLASTLLNCIGKLAPL